MSSMKSSRVSMMTAWKMTKKKKAKMNMMRKSKRRVKKKRQMRLIDESRQFIVEVIDAHSRSVILITMDQAICLLR